MIGIVSGIFTRIVSNSYINVFQKTLTSKGEKSSVVNFYTYFGLTLLGLFFIPFFQFNISEEFVFNFLMMGILGALGNYFIIKALSIGELSSIAPINSYKPIVALVFSFFYLKETPSMPALFGILLIIGGTYILHKSLKPNNRAVFYRFLALCFSGIEAVFIKKIILLTNIPTSFFLWALSGFIFSSLFIIKYKKINLPKKKEFVYLVLSVLIMQYSTNYLFSKMNVSYALALFQLSTLLSVFLGINIFHEKELKRKVIVSTVMIIGAIFIVLN